MIDLNGVNLRDVIKMIIFKLSEANDSAGLFDADPISYGEFDEDTRCLSWRLYDCFIPYDVLYIFTMYLE